MFLVPVTRRSPEWSRLFGDIDRFFNAPSAAAPSAPTAAILSPALDVTESPQAWTVKLDLPGVAKEDVKVAIEGNQVSVQAQVRQEAERGEGERIVYRERSAGSYARRFTLPAEVDQSQSAARLDNGVLTLTLGKRSAAASAHLTVN
ncbi:MAG: Hsp20/alpha crystallin family protein [Rubrivivax sp.]